MCRKIGITGGSGSGKGYVCAILKEMGYPCIDTDSVVHSLYSENQACLMELRKEFGKSIFENGVLVRKKLAGIVFSDKDKLSILNTIVHKYVVSECESICERYNKQGHGIVFIDAPQLYEAGMDKLMDSVIAVIAPVDVRLSRIVERDSLSVSMAQKRIDNQLPNEFFIRNAEFIIENDSCTKEELKNRLKEILAELGV